MAPGLFARSGLPISSNKHQSVFRWKVLAESLPLCVQQPHLTDATSFDREKRSSKNKRSRQRVPFAISFFLHIRFQNVKRKKYIVDGTPLDFNAIIFIKVIGSLGQPPPLAQCKI